MRSLTRLMLLLMLVASFGAVGAQDAPVTSFMAYGEAFGTRLSPDGRLLATFENGAIHNSEVIADYLPIRVYDIETGEALHVLEGQPDYAVQVAFSPDSTQLAALYPTGWIHIWSLDAGTLVKQMPIAPNASTMEWLADGATIAVAASQLPQVQLWDVESGAMTALLMERFEDLNAMRESLSEGPLDGVSAFAAAPDGELFALATFYDAILLWTPDGEMTTLYQPDENLPHLSFRSLAFTADGSQLLALHSGESTVYRFDVANAELLDTLEVEGVRGRAVAVSPDGTTGAALIGSDEAIALLDFETGHVTSLPLPEAMSEGWATPMSSLYFTADGERLILAGHFEPGSDPAENPVLVLPISN